MADFHDPVGALLVADPDEDTRRRAALTLAGLCVRADGAPDDLRVALATLGLVPDEVGHAALDRLSASVSVPEPEPTRGHPPDLDEPVAARSAPGGRGFRPLYPGGPLMCGSGEHEVTPESVSVGADDKRKCKPCRRKAERARRAQGRGSV
jgi:hypothetical protein